MIEVYADGQLVYSNRLPEYKVLGLQTTTGLNKSGTATIILPPGHPAYNSFVSKKTVVTLLDDGVLQFRGRVLYPVDDLYNRRTITCEGERGFFRDIIARPYLYETSPAEIFAQALARYNAEADSFKRFTLGTVTVTDTNDYVRFESTTAENFGEFFDKLVERCGGYITFSDDGKGGRAVNWLEEVGTESDQAIEFGVNMLDFSRSGQSDDLATAVLPYGAQLEDGTRVGISSITPDGSDYIKDDQAVALRGFIMAVVTWDDVTEPANLLTKAQKWLDQHRLAVTSLQLSAADLAKLGRNVGTYGIGDQVPVRSKPHSLDDRFQLTDRTTNWLDPAGGSVTLGKTSTSLTGADVQLQQSMGHIKVEIINTAKVNAGAVVKEAEQRLTSKIEQLADSITLEVSGTLGGTASIKLSVLGDTTAYSLDLAKVRAAFANDTSAVTISAGVISFVSNTIVINSDNFTVDNRGNITATSANISGTIKATSGRIGADGEGWTIDDNSLYYGDDFASATAFLCTGSNTSMTIGGHTGSGWVFKAGSKFGVTSDGALYCTSANLTGSLTSTSGKYKAQVSSGGIRFFYDGTTSGMITSDTYSGSAKGLQIRAESSCKYIMFHWENESTGNLAYVINNGWTSNYAEVNLFYSSSRFIGDLYLSGVTYARGLRMYENSFIKSCDSSGNVGEEMLGYSNDRVNVGGSGCATMLRGTTVYLKNTSTTVTSDRNAKNSIEELPDAYEIMFDNLVPVRYKYNDGRAGRYHVGYIAQDVEAALTAAGLNSMDFAGYVNVETTDGELGLAYDEFIALQAMKIKRLERRIVALETAKQEGN